MDASSVLSYKRLMALLISLEETVALMHWSLFWFIVYESFFHFSATCHADMQLVVNCSKWFCHTLFVQWLTDSCVKSSMSLMSILIWSSVPSEVYHKYLWHSSHDNCHRRACYILQQPNFFRKSTILLLVPASFYVVYYDPPAFFLQKNASKSLDLQSSAQQGSKLHALFTTRMLLYWKLEHK